MQNLYNISSGNIYIGDHNLKFFTNHSLRAKIACVPQNLDLFAGNVVENIAVGEFEPDMERILKICKQLGLLTFIESLPQNFGTYLGENGASLSGGQKQRLAIARALYKNPEILIMDEATSSLDSESESFVQQTINHLKADGKTIIVIAHRLSTIMNADCIAVLEKGKLIEQGTHYKLFDLQGKYYQMWQKQFPMLEQKQFNLR